MFVISLSEINNALRLFCLMLLIAPEVGKFCSQIKLIHYPKPNPNPYLKAVIYEQPLPDLPAQS